MGNYNDYSQYGGGQYDNNNGGNSRSNYNNNTGGNRSNRGFSSGNNNAKPKKRSGCKVTRGGVGKGICCGWRISKRFGFVKYLAFFHEKSHDYNNRDGQKRITCCIKAEYEDGRTAIMPAIYNPDNKKVTIQKVAMVMNPSAPNGGYIGTYRRK